jgi:protein involved in polysaccharide export with SLBB domain/capsular polysaccharide biosynthesis protein
MNEDLEFDLNSEGLPNSPIADHDEDDARSRTRAQQAQRRARQDEKKSHKNDFLALGELVLNRWKWIFAVTLLMAGAGFYLGAKLCKWRYTATVQLLRYEAPNTEDYFKTTPMSPETFASILRAPELLEKVASKMQPPVPIERLAKMVKVEPQVDSDVVKISVPAPSEHGAVELANFYGNEAVKYMTDLQAKVFGTMGTNYLFQQLKKMDEDIAKLQHQFRNMPSTVHDPGETNALGGTAPRPSIITLQLTEKLQTALEDLITLQSKYTDAHPAVQQKKAEVDSMRGQIEHSRTNSSTANISQIGVLGFRSGTPGTQTSMILEPEVDMIRTKLHVLEEGRLHLAQRVEEAKLLAATPPGNCRLFAPATLRAVKSNLRWVKVSFLAVFLGVVGLAGMTCLFLLVEVVDNRLKTAADVRRVTGLPVIASLGDLNRMLPSERAKWAFRTWTMLQGRLSPSANHGLVCGITSSKPGEGRSTWVSLLAEAASMTGFRVLTIATKPAPAHRDLLEDAPEEEENEMKTANGDGNPNDHGNANGNGNPSTALTSNVLAAPSQVTDKLTGPNSQPMVHIPLPGWVWNLERRKQWRDALGHWRRIDNLVILVELPPGTMSESVLLGSNLPNLLWLTDSGKAEATETRSQLETLRHARCNLVGAVLNHEPPPPIQRRFARWINCAALMASLSLSAVAQETNIPATAPAVPAPVVEPTLVASQTNLSFSASARSGQRAPWQQRLTLGPGDVLDFGLYGAPELNRKELFIGPDGRVSYLEAANIMAAGLTIDELRDRFDQELSKFRRAPRTMITPVAFKSKKYYVLGKVVGRGVYSLDRPLTVLEALARAKGFETAMLDRNTIDIADYQRSFLMRGGKRIPLNFERLFGEGDLAQNILIEPEDYLFFPASALNEVYVLGEVRIPGIVNYTKDMSVVAALSTRAGFTEKAWKRHVLVVRGSINNPETFIVNVAAILEGKERDFALKPKDIVYVHYRPWSRIEDLLDLAITAFIQSSITGWVTEELVKPQ